MNCTQCPNKDYSIPDECLGGELTCKMVKKRALPSQKLGKATSLNH